MVVIIVKKKERESVLFFLEFFNRKPWCIKMEADVSKTKSGVGINKHFENKPRRTHAKKNQSPQQRREIRKNFKML